ncbi:MAG: hypothetical protein IJU71_03460, partial [Selenomonadaceae bacterium]|nr:hypothetical protein [Selenomonadaceae bacterium]
WNVNANDIQSGNAGFNGDSDGVTLNVGGENIMTVRRANNASTTTVQLLDGTRWSYDYSSGSAQLMTVPRGLIVSGRTVSVTSAFEGNLWLGGVDQNGDAVWGSDYLTNIDAYEDDGIRFLVGNAENNSIRAGHNGSTLWGGSSGYDTLRGGDGNDVFYAGKGEYYTRVANYNSNDLIYLWNANFSDLKNMAVQSDYFFKSIGILFNDGSTVEASSSFEETTTFKFADGSFMRYDPSTNTWQSNTDGTWQTFSELDNAPIGVLALDDTAMIYSDHVGAFALVDLNDSSVTRVNATNDTISGRILIGDEQNNRIYANDYGNQLWGGNGGSDTLTGGSGADTFIAGLGEGNVSISNYASNDLVYLWNADRYDIKSMVVQNRTNRREVRLTTVEDDTVKAVSRLDEETISFQLADGFTFRYVVADNAWQSYDSSTDEWQVFTSINGMPVGLELEYDYNDANIYTDYVGNFSLSEFNDSLITDIWAYDEVSGRVLIGDEQSNYIYAGGGGVSMWGGNGGDDILVGNSGDDTFVAGQGEGDCYIYNCSSSDLVYLHNINFSDLKYLRVYVENSSKAVDAVSEDGTFIAVWSDFDEETTNYQFADGSFMRYNATDNAWQRSTDGSTWSTFTSVNGTPVGVQVYDDTAQVYSDFVGVFDLNDLNDSLVTGISAYNDTLSGRVLIGDAQDNWIRANDYGSSLWGGNGGDDALVGDSGDDTFVAGQ